MQEEERDFKARSKPTSIDTRETYSYVPTFRNRLRSHVLCAIYILPGLAMPFKHPSLLFSFIPFHIGCPINVTVTALLELMKRDCFLVRALRVFVVKRVDSSLSLASSCKHVLKVFGYPTSICLRERNVKASGGSFPFFRFLKHGFPSVV